MPELFRLIDGNNQFHYHQSREPTFDMLVDRMIGLMREQHPTQAFMVFDGFDSRARRREIYPEYKRTAGRIAKAADTQSYTETYQNLTELKKQLQDEGIPLIEVAKTEADDIIGLITKRLGVYYPKAVIQIYSTDRDFHSLGVNPHVQFPYSSAMTGVKPSEMLLYKSLVGDSSDNIKGMRLFGHKSWEKLDDDSKGALQAALEQGHPAPIERFEAQWESIELAWKLVNFVYDDALTNYIDSLLKERGLCQSL